MTSPSFVFMKHHHQMPYSSAARRCVRNGGGGSGAVPLSRTAGSFSWLLSLLLLLLLLLSGHVCDAQFVDLERLAEDHDPSWWDRWAGRRPLLPLTQCSFRLISVFLDGRRVRPILDIDLYRDDSQVILAQAGVYQGPDGIREYLGFADAEFSPYLLSGPEGQAEVYFRRYNGRTGNCEFSVTYVGRYVTNPDTTTGRDERRVPLLAKLHLAYQDGYIRQLNFFFAEGFLGRFFTDWLNSPQSREYVCEVLHGPSCGEPEESGPSCPDRMAALPLVDSAETGTVVGNSQGCRYLHAVLAQRNPLHCAHIAFDRTVDAKGNVRCQDESLSLARDPDDLFDNFDFWLFENRAWRAGIDLDVGFD